MSDNDGVSRGESVRDRRHRPMSHVRTVIVMDQLYILLMHLSMYCPTAPPPLGRKWGFTGGN